MDTYATFLFEIVQCYIYISKYTNSFEEAFEYGLLLSWTLNAIAGILLHQARLKIIQSTYRKSCLFCLLH